jgi:hypothetical protein
VKSLGSWLVQIPKCCVFRLWPIIQTRSFVQLAVQDAMDGKQRWARSAIDINGIWGGFSGEGVKTVTPCAAHLKLTCRLVPLRNAMRGYCIYLNALGQ